MIVAPKKHLGFYEKLSRRQRGGAFHRLAFSPRIERMNEIAREFFVDNERAGD